MSYKLTVEENYIEEKRQLLRDFGIRMTANMVARIKDLYPNDIAIENYIHKIICDHLDRLN